MIEILESAKHLVAIKISGSLTGADVEKASAALDKAIAENERISVFVDVDPSMALTFEGVVKDFIDGISRLGQLSRIYRAALVTDKGWMAAIARVEGLVFASIDLRVYAPEDRDKALAWASETPEPLPKPDVPEPSIRLIHTTNENVFAWEVDGRIREKDIKSALEGFEPFLKRDGKLNALVRMTSYGGFDLSAILDDDLLKIKYRALSKLEKYAIIGAKPWMRNLAELMGGVIGPEVRVFDAAEEHQAWEWVGAQQALLPE
jgi:hypothetical protein